MSKVGVLPPAPCKTFLVKIGRTSFAVPVVIAAAGVVIPLPVESRWARCFLFLNQ
jgi:hypothetical protein